MIISTKDLQNKSNLSSDASIIWLNAILKKRPNLNEALLKQALILARLAGEEQATPTGESCLTQGIDTATILNGLNADSETLAAALLYSTARYTDIKSEDLTEHVGTKISKLIYGTKQMSAISELYRLSSQNSEQQKQNVDNIRKMLLAMVDDIRAVLIKLAERLVILRRMALFHEKKRQETAEETMALYAPLANRLGFHQIKWEMEDLSFRYLEPAQYDIIAKYLKLNRTEREEHIKEVVARLNELLAKEGIKKFTVSGRAKHIYSIYRKMQRKKVGPEEIYDISAIRILLPTIEDCYKALSLVHSAWKPLHKEFDDYIATPKENGYRSIHTAVIGPDGKSLEIQIRTFEMHEIAELGVAAHWVYKEGAPQKSAYENKIAWLRQVMDWQKEVTAQEDTIGEVKELFNDRVYVFTPNGDILDLAQGSTPLDFAYHLHSELGNRCRGAKVNGVIVPLTYQLKTGEHVEVITVKQGGPSRDWLNSNLGFLISPRAKAKILHYFKKLDQEQHIVAGQKNLETELKRLNIRDANISDATKKLEYKTNDEMFAALGSGDLKISSIINSLQIATAKEESKNAIAVPTVAVTRTKKTGKDVEVHGIGNVLMHFAKCCQPVPGDKIIGYVTQGNGVAIHRQDCCSITQAIDKHPEKLLAVSWGQQIESRYPVDLEVIAYDRPGLVRDISNIIANENLMIYGLNLHINHKELTAHIKLTVEISSIDALSKLLAKINQIANIIEVKRI